MNKNTFQYQIRLTLLYWIKNSIRGIFLFVLLLVSVIEGESCNQPGTVIVENEILKLVFESKPLPCLKEIIHKASGQNLLVRTENNIFFRLDIAHPQGGTYSVENQSAVNGFMKTTRIADNQTITIEYEEIFIVH